MEKQLKDKRINVRANFKMKQRLKIIKYYLEEKQNRKLSDSETLEIIIDEIYKNGFEIYNDEI